MLLDTTVKTKNEITGTNVMHGNKMWWITVMLSQLMAGS
jgi:hypothetical protein